MNPGAFDRMADLYDLLTDWDRRLPAEAAFLDALLRKEGARTVLDAACGTGVHLLALAERGYRVSGSDASPEMVERARERLEGIEGVELAALPFERAGDRFSGKDAVLVLGNSLPLAGSADGVRRSLAGLARAARPGGLLVLHCPDYVRLRAGGGGLRPPRRVVVGETEYIFLKLFEIHPGTVVLDLIVLVREGDAIRERLVRSALFPLTLGFLEQALPGAGLALERTLGSFGGAPYEEGRSPDLLAICRRTC